MLAIVTCLRQTLYQPVNLLNLTDEICFAKASPSHPLYIPANIVILYSLKLA